MIYSLEQFIGDCRAALFSDDGPVGRERVRQSVEKVLGNEAFIAKYLGDDNTTERQILYEDPDLGFCICAHVYLDPNQGKPHDHGSTWAIYGQAVGETEMTDWKIITAPNDETPGKVEMVKSYRMRPGDAHLYETGAVHAPMREGPTRLIRIEGQNTEKLKRTPLQPA